MSIRKSKGKKGKSRSGKSSKLAATAAAFGIVGSVVTAKPALLEELKQALLVLASQQAHAAAENQESDNQGMQMTPQVTPVIPGAPVVVERTTSFGELLKIQVDQSNGPLWTNVTWIKIGSNLAARVSQPARQREINQILEQVKRDFQNKELN